jgi:hypothetical protein
MGILERLGTNPTQVAGALSFALTTLACLNTARGSTSREARAWKVLSFVQALFLLEVLVGFRFRVLEFARTALKQEGLYDRLHGRVQGMVVAAIATGALLLVTIFLFSRSMPGGAARLAASMTVVISALFAIEMISLHELDAVLYRPIGPLLMIGWVWIAGATVICFAMLHRRSGKSLNVRPNA